MPSPGRQHDGPPRLPRRGRLFPPSLQARTMAMILTLAPAVGAPPPPVPPARDSESIWQKPLESSITPVFTTITTGPATAALTPEVSNFRLVLEYSADAPGTTISLAGWSRPLLPGQNQRAEFAVEQSGEGPIIIRAWRTGRAKPDTFDRPLPVPRLPAVAFADIPGHPVGGNLTTTAGFTLHRAWIQPLALADHHAIMALPEAGALEMGAAIHAQVCASCHGGPESPPAHALARPLGRDAPTIGQDAFSIWQVIRFGHGEMPPQPALTTTQAYAVARFITSTLPDPIPGAPANQPAPARPDHLPRGMTTTGEPESVPPPPWALMDFGPMLFHPIAVGNHPDGKPDLVGKAITIRLDPGPGGLTRGRAWAVYDHESLRLAAWAEGGNLHDNHQLAFDGSPDTPLTLTATRRLPGATGPGWAHPATGSWDDPRPRAPSGHPIGPMPRDWLQFHALHVHGPSVVLAYSVGSTRVLESPAWDKPGQFTRHFQIGPSTHDLVLRPGRGDPITITAARCPARLSVSLAADGTMATRWNEGPDLDALTRPGPPRFPSRMQTSIVRGPATGPFTVDHLVHPLANAQPGASWMRFTGFDFLSGKDTAALCTWNGDVWLVDGLDRPDGRLEWRRFASGLSQPMGLKVKDGAIHVGCLDQIVRLEDADGNGEADTYHCLNSDHEVTGNAREFARDLKVDGEGNFLYAKGTHPGQTGSPPQHGSLLRVARDGSSTTHLGGGLPAPGGIALLPDASLLVTNQSSPETRRNTLVRFNPALPEPFVLSRLPDSFDPGLSQPLRIPARYGWGGLDGTTLCLSQGSGRLIGLVQAPAGHADAVAAWHLPVPPFPTGLLAGRLREQHLYLCGMDGWFDGHAAEGGFFRLRPTGKDYLRPVAIHTTRTTLALKLSQAPDPLKAVDPRSYQLRTWPTGPDPATSPPAAGESLVRIERAAVHDRTIFLRVAGLTAGQDGALRVRIHDHQGNFHELNLAFTLPEVLPEPPPILPATDTQTPGSGDLSPDLLPGLMPDWPDSPPDPTGPAIDRLPELDDPVAPIDPDQEEPLPRK